MSEDGSPSAPKFPVEIELRIFNFLLHDDFRRSAASFLRLSKGHFSTYAPRSCHTVIITNTNILNLSGLFTGGDLRPYHTFVKRVVFARAFSGAYDAALVDMLKDHHCPVLPNLESLIISRQYVFESAVYLHDYDEADISPLFPLFVKSRRGLSTYIDMDIPVHQMFLDIYRRIDRPLAKLPARWLKANFATFWEREDGSSPYRYLDAILTLFYDKHEAYTGHKPSPLPSILSIRNVVQLDRVVPRPPIYGNRHSDYDRMILHMADKVPSFLAVHETDPTSIFEPGRASEALCDNLAEILDFDGDLQVWLQNASMTEQAIANAAGSYGEWTVRTRQSIVDRLKEIRHFKNSDRIPCPCDFDNIGGRVDCRNWETLDYTSWDEEKNAVQHM